MPVDIDYGAVDTRKKKLVEHQQFLKEQDEKKRQADEARRSNVLLADYSGYSNIDEMLRGLSSAEINLLRSQSASFKKRLEDFDLIEAFRRLKDEDQAIFFAEANEGTRITLENDGYVAQQTLTLAPSSDEAAAEAAAARAATETEVAPEEAAQAEATRLQAEADRLAAESAAAGTVPTVPKGSVEELYDGIEKIGEGSYKLTVNPGDGTNPEIFYGTTQRECFKALRKSKAAATKELRRRAKKVQITEELRNLEVETINYAPLLQPLKLTNEQIFDLVEQQKDPATVLQATTKLRQASLTQEECDRANESLERQRFSDAFNTAQTWLKLRPDFYNHPDNIAALRDLMGNLGWAVTMKNLDLAFEVLLEQEGVLLERPEPQTTEPPPAQPAFVVPVAVAPVTPVVPTAQIPAVTPSALPGPKRILRPGSLAETSTGIQPTVRLATNTGAAPRVQPMSAEEANSYTAADLKKKYNADPAFKARLDAYWASGGR